MRHAGLYGVVRRHGHIRTTTADVNALRPPDLVKGNFTATRPNELWVVDFTYVHVFIGFVFTAFVTDVFSRRLVGWRTFASMPPNCPWTRWRADGRHRWASLTQDHAPTSRLDKRINSSPIFRV